MNKNNVKSEPSFYVGIGASAGGLEAIDTFFTHMPSDSGMAFIVVQHLSPNFKSLMVELLSKKTEMPVHRVEHKMQAMPNNIYLIPPKKLLTIKNGVFHLSEQPNVNTINLPIDVFLTSLADDQREKTISIILSGTGSDGTRGIRRIKELGGLIILQDESTAKFDGMPRSARSTGLADLILAPDQMPKEIMAYADHPFAIVKNTPSVSIENNSALTRIFSELKNYSKVDFSQYKPSTINRRIERRLSINQIDNIDSYADLVQVNQNELMTLFKELLIGVTSFFRDKEVYDVLIRYHIKHVFKNEQKEIRAWIPGCSTGEEAYSIAILFREYMEKNGLNFDVKIFATDIDRQALQAAGVGVYPESIAADIAPDLLSKYFYHKDESFQVTRNIREMVVFAQHDIIKDPPFTKMDFISCRNLLIYLQPVLQQKIFEMFNFSLRKGGILLLGSSETIGNMNDYFATLEQKYKIFQSRGRSSYATSPRLFSPPSTLQKDKSVSSEMNGYSNFELSHDRLTSRYLDLISQNYIPLSVVVNEKLEIVLTVGNSDGYFRIPSGRIVNDISKMAIKDLSISISTGIHQVFKKKQEIVFTNIQINRGDDNNELIDLRIIPFASKRGLEDLVAIFIEKKEKVSQPEQVINYDVNTQATQRIKDLESELQFTKENLQAAVEELETSNEELQATNEELLASNEELQSTNEELQSTNEELYTVNNEYQNKIMEMVELNNDVENLLSSAGIAKVLLDENLDVRKFSDGISNIFDFNWDTIKQPLVNMQMEIDDFNLLEAVKDVQITSRLFEKQIKMRSGKWFLLRIIPYEISPSSFSGLVLTFVDISSFKNVEAQMLEQRTLDKHTIQNQQKRLDYTEELSKIGIWSWDIEIDQIFLSDELYRLFNRDPHKYNPTFKEFLELFTGKEMIKFEKKIQKILTDGISFEMMLTVALPDKTALKCVTHCAAEKNEDGKVIKLLGSFQNMSSGKE